MPQRREHPYIGAVWLSRLLTGENSRSGVSPKGQ